MENNTNQNIQPQVPPHDEQQMPPFTPMPPQMGMPMRHRRRNAAVQAKAIFPQWLSRNALITYFLALAVVTFMYSAYSLPWYYMLSGVVAVGVFFLYGSTAIKDTSLDKIRKENRFEKRIFLIAFIPRVIWMFLIYTIFMNSYGDAFGFENADANTYHIIAQEISEGLRKGHVNYESVFGGMDLSDRGYGTYLGFVYFLCGDSVLISRIVKCLLSAITVVLLYRLAKRNFDIQTARMSAIFCALWPNFWYYCGCQLKEVEMVFLGVLFVEQADQMLRSRQFTAWKVIPVLLIAAAILTFRTPLALVAFLSLIFSVVMSSSRVVNWGKRIIVGVLAVLLIAVTMGNRLEEQSQQLFDAVKSNEQETNMEWRGVRENGNSLAKYAGKSVFAPLIFTIPFPTILEPFKGQDVQQLNNGGNFVKNILSGFTIFAMVMLLISGKWREHLLPLSFLLGYLVVLTASNFAHSERFHQPVMPFEFMFAAYGLSIAVTQKKYKRWFTYWCGLMFIAAIAWSWFKMAGRGLA